MKKLSKRGALLCAVVVACAAFASPGAASALNWGPVGTAHTLDSSSVTLDFVGLSSRANCIVELNTSAANPASSSLTITGASFTSCFGAGAAASCGVAVVATGLNWTATGLAANNVKIDGMHVNVIFSGATCAIGNPATVTVTGSLTGGVWNAAGHSVAYTVAAGLTGFLAGSPIGAVVTSGSFSDTAGTLTLA